MGAQPSAWATIIFGNAVSLASHPPSIISRKTFHMPINPVPPPVGYTMCVGSFQLSCSASSMPIVFLPSMR